MIFDLLNECLDCGLMEEQFWGMSFDEIERFKQSYVRREQNKQKEIINYLYILADLSAISHSRIHNKNAKYPKKEELFPDLYPLSEEEKLKAFVANFKLFANSNNQKFAKQGE